MVDLRSAEFIANDVLDLVSIESSGVILEVVHVHVGRELCVDDRWVGLGDHLCPCRDVGFVDFFDCVC